MTMTVSVVDMHPPESTRPNVVETDPLTFIRLATGRIGWADALAEGRVHASGLRADLSAVLPLLS